MRKTLYCNILFCTFKPPCLRYATYVLIHEHIKSFKTGYFITLDTILFLDFFYCTFQWQIWKLCVSESANCSLLQYSERVKIYLYLLKLVNKYKKIALLKQEDFIVLSYIFMINFLYVYVRVCCIICVNVLNLR